MIEYNPRNIAIMTLLNSMLILGGLLGTMSRPDRSLPFKRVDLSRLKKRILPGRRSKVQTPQPQPPKTSHDSHPRFIVILVRPVVDHESMCCPTIVK